jgi:uncharacterized protein (TIGR02246 family)
MIKRTRNCVAIVIVSVAMTPFLVVTSARAQEFSQASSQRTADDAALRRIVAGFSEGWNNHDAQAMCSDVAEDVEWVAWSGGVANDRQAVVKTHVSAFSSVYKDTQRIDTVKSIHYLGPDLASVDDYWTMTGSKRSDGSDWPYRAGYVSFLMAKRNGRWLIYMSHTADFNAKTPGTPDAK